MGRAVISILQQMGFDFQIGLRSAEDRHGWAAFEHLFFGIFPLDGRHNKAGKEMTANDA
jgi:hypothetical protein